MERVPEMSKKCSSPFKQTYLAKVKGEFEASTTHRGKSALSAKRASVISRSSGKHLVVTRKKIERPPTNGTPMRNQENSAFSYLQHRVNKLEQRNAKLQEKYEQDVRLLIEEREKLLELLTEVKTVQSQEETDFQLTIGKFHQEIAAITNDMLFVVKSINESFQTLSSSIIMWKKSCNCEGPPLKSNIVESYVFCLRQKIDEIIIKYGGSIEFKHRRAAEDSDIPLEGTAFFNSLLEFHSPSSTPRN